MKFRVNPLNAVNRDELFMEFCFLYGTRHLRRNLYMATLAAVGYHFNTHR